MRHSSALDTFRPYICKRHVVSQWSTNESYTLATAAGRAHHQTRTTSRARHARGGLLVATRVQRLVGCMMDARGGLVRTVLVHEQVRWHLRRDVGA